MGVCRDLYSQQHGQGQPQATDRQHELPGQDGALASVKVDRGNEGVHR